MSSKKLKMKDTQKKIRTLSASTIFIVTLTILTSGFISATGIAYANNTTPPPTTTTPTDDLSEAKFNVKEVLTLDKANQPKKYFDDEEYSPIVSFILDIINFATTIMGSIAVILFIIAGFMFMLGQGNQQKIDEAKDVIKYATIGLIVAFLSYIITIFVQSIFVAN